MSKIAAFKSLALAYSPPRKPKIQQSDVRASLVGATLGKRTANGTQFVYRDGRVCNHPDGEQHDCGYVAARNKLIPLAEALARDEMITAGVVTVGGAFARVFMAAMDKLWRERHLPGASA